MFALDFPARARADAVELQILLLSLGRGGRSLMGLPPSRGRLRGHGRARQRRARRRRQHDGALKQGMREGRGGGEYLRRRAQGRIAGTCQEAARLPRKDFVGGGRVLNPYCCPPVVLDALRKLVRRRRPAISTRSARRREGPRADVDLGAEAAALMMDDSAYEPDPVPTKRRSTATGRGCCSPKKTDASRAGLRAVCKVPASRSSRAASRASSSTPSAARSSRRPAPVCAGQGQDYLYLIEDGHVAVDADGGFWAAHLPAADGTPTSAIKTTKAPRAGRRWRRRARLGLDKLTLSEILKDSQQRSACCTPRP